MSEDTDELLERYKEEFSKLKEELNECKEGLIVAKKANESLNTMLIKADWPNVVTRTSLLFNGLFIAIIALSYFN